MKRPSPDLFHQRFHHTADDHIGQRFVSSFPFFSRSCSRVTEVGFNSAGFFKSLRSLLDLFRNRNRYSIERLANLLSDKLWVGGHHQRSFIRSGMEIASPTLFG